MPLYTSEKCHDLLNNAFKDIKASYITRLHASGYGINITFSNQSRLKASAYAFIDEHGTKFNASSDIPFVEAQWRLLENSENISQDDFQEQSDSLMKKKYSAMEDNDEVAKQLTEIIQTWPTNMRIADIEYSSSVQFKISFVEKPNFFIELFTKHFSPYSLDVETKQYSFQVFDTECRITQEKVKKDYKSFSSAAKSRFRSMAKELGYEQITGIVYVKERDGWYETFNLQASTYGNPFFYLNYGVIIPREFPASREELKNSGWRFGGRLSYNGMGSFPSGSKKQIEESAAYALEAYKKELAPWFHSLTLKKIKNELK